MPISQHVSLSIIKLVARIIDGLSAHIFCYIRNCSTVIDSKKMYIIQIIINILQPELLFRIHVGENILRATIEIATKVGSHKNFYTFTSIKILSNRLQYINYFLIKVILLTR